MKKPIGKRLGLCFIQHILAAVIMVLIAVIVFNSYVAVKSMDTTKTYRINFYEKQDVFEDSELFHNIFDTAVSDIIRLVVIKGQLETDGVFDGQKQIDVTEYASRKGNGNDCPITAVYQLDDLIKWGINGLEYNNRPWSLSDFVNYFGPVINPYNFALDEYGELYFSGFNNVTLDMISNVSGWSFAEEQIPQQEWNLAEEELFIWEKMQKYTTEQLEDMAFSYIVREIPQGINPSREDDGSQTVYLTALNCRYDTVDGERQLFAYADNWIDYMKLQNNLADTITSLTINYEKYQNCTELYQEKNSNLKYAVQMMTDEGLRTYTNVKDLADEKESNVTEYFEEFRKYFVYYPDSMEFTGNTTLSGDDVYNYIRDYEYAYPETTHIWVGVDTSYLKEDVFYNANEVFQRVVPHLELIVGIIAALVGGWLAIAVYLTVTDGVMYNEEGEKVHYLCGIDHIWTEVMFSLAFAGGYVGAKCFGSLMEYADSAYSGSAQVLGIIIETDLCQYGMFPLYGILLSAFVTLFWYSFVRRFRQATLWSGSFVYMVLHKVYNGIDFVLSHGNTAISTLLPYNFFILVNMAGILAVYMFRMQAWVIFTILLVLVLFDGCIGVMLFKNSAERADIVEGIKRIREGEVDYKLETESLHGANKEMADAVNNIGEGIRKAVKTSMKDEQMKTDLITNVSHDIKTPLTSIISYVDLLKRLKIEEEPAKSYIAILDNKSQRLKQLTDDLVEASKISSGNIELQKEQLNLIELLNQSIGEFSEKFEEKRLQVIIEGKEVSAYIFADSRRMWRVIENLFNNICKYALVGTRVYLELWVENGRVKLSMKNISERQMNIRADELTERFIRGDESRTTEGSGLGLSIAKSLIEVQGGNFIIYLDGDLFKVEIDFPEYAVQTIEEVNEGESSEVGRNVEYDVL